YIRGTYTQGGSEPRGWLAVTTLVDGQQVQVFNTHLAQAGQSAIRASEVKELVAEATATKPTIVLGDFNAEPGTPEMAPMWRPFREADRGCTPPAFGCKVTADASPHRKKFDYIFLSRDIEPPGNGVHQTATSDHDLVHADITLPFPPTSPEGGGKPFDLPPTVHAGADRSGSEGSAVSLNGSASDDHGTPRVHWSYHAGADVDAGASCGFSSPSAVRSRFTCTDDGTFTVTLTASDGVHAPVSDSAVVRLRNVAPTLHLTGAKPWSVYRAGRSARVTATFTDPGSNDTHTCRIGWDDGGSADVSHPGNGSCGRTHTFAHAGMYSTGLRVTDDDGGSDAASTMLVVYDPTAGLAVGAGTVRSPAHALAGSGTSGAADFVALAKYLGADDTSPTGGLSYALPGTSLGLSATKLEWLVITADGKAALKGSAKVDGQDGYGFVAYLQSGGFRTVVWPTSQGSIPPATPLYDNRRGASYDLDSARPQPIDGGTTLVDHGWVPGVPSLDGNLLATVQRYGDLMPKTLGIDLKL
ncbi:MAG TPA: PKD domain-containing protein, partial [Actinopolymorphaceae bacterium]|nr:PKD domain-containing protein [Actinopolymorphaceae bacterium]